jgi:hypothetical protein
VGAVIFSIHIQTICTQVSWLKQTVREVLHWQALFIGFLKDFLRVCFKPDYLFSCCYRRGKFLLVCTEKERHKKKTVLRLITGCHAKRKTLVARSPAKIAKLALQKYNKRMDGVGVKNKDVYHLAAIYTARTYERKIFRTQ